MHAIMPVQTHASKAALTPAKDRHQVLVPIAPMPAPTHAAALAVADAEVIVQGFVADLAVMHVAAIAQASVMARVEMSAVLVAVLVVLENAVVHVVTRAAAIALVYVKALVVMLVAMVVVQVVPDNVVVPAELRAVTAVAAVALDNVIQLA